MRTLLFHLVGACVLTFSLLASVTGCSVIILGHLLDKAAEAQQQEERNNDQG